MRYGSKRKFIKNVPDTFNLLPIQDPDIKAYTVYTPTGPYENQTYYYLQVLRTFALSPHYQYWVWDGTQTKSGVTVYNENSVPGVAHVPVPNVP